MKKNDCFFRESKIPCLQKVLRAMKLTIYLFLFSVMSVFAGKTYSQTKGLTIDLKNSTVKEVLQNIETQSEFYFMYSEKLVDVKREVSVNVKDKKINEVLDGLFAGTDVSYKVRDRFILLTTPEVSGNELVDQQQVTVSGKVTDSSRQPLPGVTVAVKGKAQGTITDANGNYSLSNVQPDAVLVFSFVGMKTQEVAVGNQMNINVKMQEEAIGIEEVVAVGYGKMSKEVLSTSISELNKQTLENIPYTNPASALQGNIAGVRVQSTSGQPGARPVIIIRGGTSINNPEGSTPLFVIDGLTASSMDHINPNQIESIYVLKDAASTSIYGARASNGVIIVTTKSGKAGKTQVSYNYSMTIASNARYFNLASPQDQVKFSRLGYVGRFLANRNQALPGGTGNDLTKNTPFTTMFLTPENEYLLQKSPDPMGAVWTTMPDPFDASKTLIYKATDIQKTIYRRAISQNHNFSVSGGSEKATFNIGFEYLDNKGIVVDTDYKRISMNLNGDIKAGENLQFFGRIIYANVTDRQAPGSSDLFKGVQYASPLTKFYFEDGTLAPGRQWGYANPAYYISSYNTKNETNDLMLNLGGRWDIFPGLSYEPQYSLKKTFLYQRSFLKAHWITMANFDDSRPASGSHTMPSTQSIDGVMTFLKSLMDAHNFEIKAGHSFLKTTGLELSAQAKGAATDNIPTLNAAVTPTKVFGFETEYIIDGFFGRINYDYDKKYLLTINARYDGASNLGEDHKWGFFPGISIGWNLHKEKFWKVIPENLLKLKTRLSYGVNGNISGLGPYTSQGIYSVDYRYNNIAAIINTTLANKELQWERSKSLDFGSDLTILNKINIVFDFYRRVTDQLLTDFSLPPSTGFKSVLTNFGSLENKGVEFDVNANIMPVTSDFQWNLSFNVSKWKNKILKLPDNEFENNRVGGVYIWDSKLGDYSWKGGLQEGGRIGDLFAYKQLSVYATDEEAAAGPVDKLITAGFKKGGGDVNWLDADGNNIIDERDRIYVGNIYPDCAGGFTNSFSYKNINLSIRLDYMTGHTIENDIEMRLYANPGEHALSADVTKSWQKQGDITDFPIYRRGEQNFASNLWRGNDRYFQAGDYLCIREITLQYNLPQSIIERLRLSGLRFNITGNNLYHFTPEYTTQNPEQTGIDNGRYALPRCIIFGMRISL